MESLQLFRLARQQTKHLLSKALREHSEGRWRLSTFNDLPTAMLFRPNEEHEGSLHYMFFPASASQKFHYHPSARYLILIGDIDVHIHYSYADTNENPNLSESRILLPSYTLNAVRFRPNLWHRFETMGEEGLGVIAFSFHGDDNVNNTSEISDSLMEEITFFWEGA
jgi:hypothetical protein